MNPYERLGLASRLENSVNSLRSLIARNIMCYTNLVVYARSTERIPRVNTGVRVSVRRGRLDDVEGLLAFIGGIPRRKHEAKLLKRMRNGHICFLAERRKEDVVGFCWIAFGELYLSEIDTRIDLKDTETCLYDALVLQTYRGKRVFQKILVEILGFLREIGCRKTFITVSTTNIPSRRAVERVGFRSVKTVSFFRLFGLKRASAEFAKFPDESSSCLL